MRSYAPEFNNVQISRMHLANIIPDTNLSHLKRHFKTRFLFKHCHTKFTSIAQFQLDFESNSIFHCQVMDISNQHVIPKIFTQLQLL